MFYETPPGKWDLAIPIKKTRAKYYHYLHQDSAYDSPKGDCQEPTTRIKKGTHQNPCSQWFHFSPMSHLAQATSSNSHRSKQQPQHASLPFSTVHPTELPDQWCNEILFLPSGQSIHLGMVLDKNLEKLTLQ